MIRKIVLLCCLTVSLVIYTQDYKLVWEDNFDGPALDDSKWNVVENGKGGGNRELQYYRRRNINIDQEPVSGESCLVITAKKERFRFKKATSGRLNTNGKLDFRYGKVEAKIKLPKTGNGLWPAFWMLGSDHKKVGWPKCGEVDILEMGNVNGIKENIQDRFFNGACHWGEAFNHGKYPNYSKASVNSYSLQDGFHLFTMVWDDQYIKMYLDLDKYPENKPYFEMPIQGKNELNDPARYFHKPFFLILNLAVGGNFPETRKIKDITALESGEAKMYVDYVRLYQKSGEKDLLSVNNQEK